MHLPDPSHRNGLLEGQGVNPFSGDYIFENEERNRCF